MKEVTFKGDETYNSITMNVRNNILLESGKGIAFRALLLSLLFMFYFNSYSQTYHLPDTNFRNLLRNSYPSVMDSTYQYLYIPAANTLQGTLDCSNQNIKDLSGIEFFINIGKINCSHNQLTSIPSLGGNLNFLTELDCSYNHLSSLPGFNIGATNLNSIKCSNNLLTNLQDYSFLTNLDTLECQNNYLTFDDLIKNNSTNMSKYIYAPQYPVEIVPKVVLESGNNYIFTFTADDSSVVSSNHKVFRNGIQVADLNTPAFSVSNNIPVFSISNVNPSDAGFYTWQVTDSLLPALTITTTEQELIVTNKSNAIFTPDGDNNNDFYYISCDGIKSIYDKNGKLIKQLHGTTDYWDGTDLQSNPAPTGVYMIRCGEKVENSVTLIR